MKRRGFLKLAALAPLAAVLPRPTGLREESHVFVPAKPWRGPADRVTFWYQRLRLVYHPGTHPDAMLADAKRRIMPPKPGFRRKEFHTSFSPDRLTAWISTVDFPEHSSASAAG